MQHEAHSLNLPIMTWMAILLCTATPMGSLAQSTSFTTLYSFCGTTQHGCRDGLSPVAGLIQASNGYFYGTTSEGGAYGHGTVFKVSAQGRLTRLYSFCAQPECIDGGEPLAELVQGSDGDLYGTTAALGSSGVGTLFKITPEGTFSTLHTFNGSDGAQPSNRLIQGSDGNFYGTTRAAGEWANGTFFKTTPRGVLTTLHNFNRRYEGAQPGELVLATDGNFYGTTSVGGNPGCAYNDGCGTVFKITAAGTLTTIYNFCLEPDCPEGANPIGGLVQASDGNFYGTTSENANGYGNGTVFKITPEGTLTTLHAFCSEPGCADGVRPLGRLVQGSDGDLYGTTIWGGVYGGGTVFKISLAGVLTTLHSFSGPDGGSPSAGLVQATDGSFYGTTPFGGEYYGGMHGDGGTVFRMSVVSTCATCRP